MPTLSKPAVTIVAIALTALSLMAVAPVSLARASPVIQSCERDDIACRLDRIEDTLADLHERLDRLDRRGGSRGDPVPEGAVPMATNIQCSTTCISRAISQCQAAGYSRGVPARMQSEPQPGGNASYNYMTQVHCFS